MKEITVDVTASTTLEWSGLPFVVTVPEDATDEEVEDAVQAYLMSEEASLDWDWREPEIDAYEIVEDDEE